MSLIDVIAAKFAPNDCLGCGAEGNLLCKSCRYGLSPIEPKLLTDSDLKCVQSVTIYEGIAKDLIWKLKSSGAQEAARLMAASMLPLLPKECRPLIVPVPTATSRVRQRGYDQARLLAREVAKQARLPYLNCLARRGQAHQVGAGRQQRLHQLGDAFRVKNTKMIRGVHIILVDDVVTTGATLETAARLLKQAGAETIDAITFAQPRLRIKASSPQA